MAIHFHKKRLALTTLGATALGYVAMFDPASSHRFPKCVFLSITGFECPGCGSTRAVHQLLNGHPVKAFGLNPLMMVVLPWLLWRFGNWFVGRTVDHRPLDYRLIAGLAVVVVAFGVLRNTNIEILQSMSASG